MTGRTCTSATETVPVGAYETGVGVLLADHDAERTSGDVLAVEAHVDVVHAVLARDEAHRVAICSTKARITQYSASYHGSEVNNPSEFHVKSERFIKTPYGLQEAREQDSH